MCWCVSWSQGAQQQPPAPLRWCSPWRNPPDPPASTSTAQPASVALSLWYDPVLVVTLAGFGEGFGSLTHPTDPISDQEPRVSALHPRFGPREGGTNLSLHGTNLSAGSSWRVTVNGSECPLAGQPRYSPALPLLGTAGSLTRGWARGPPCSPAVSSSRSHCVPRQDGGVIQCTAPTASGLGAAWVALWIDGEKFPAPSPFQYRPDPSVLALVPSCSYE